MRLALGLLLALLLAPAALAAEPKATLPDIEDEVMCVQCGTALNVSTSPVADQEREFIRRRIAEGKGKPAIKAALVEEYGPRVLAVPEGGGFDVAAWLVAVIPSTTNTTVKDAQKTIAGSRIRHVDWLRSLISVSETPLTADR